MRDKVGSCVVACVVVACAVIAPHAARAQTYDFATCDPTVTPTTPCSSTTTSCCKQAAGAGTSFLLSGGASCSAGSCALVIPMDWCHQGTATAQSTSAPTWCGTRVGSDGMMVTYGLIYRVVQAGIKVYWAINPSKFPTALGSSSSVEIAQDLDLWILDSSVSGPPGSNKALSSAAAATSPVVKMRGGFIAADFGHDTAYGSAGYYPYKEFPIRGSAFFISATDRASFNKFVNRQSPYSSWANRSGCYSGTGAGTPSTCYDFTGVNMFEIQPNAYIGWTDFTGRCYNGGAATTNVCQLNSDCPAASPTCKWSGSSTQPPGTGATGTINFRPNEIPIAATLNYAVSKVARFGVGGVAQKWLGMANLEDASAATCASTGVISPSDAVYCAVTEANIQSGVLMSGSFNWLWLDHQSLTCGSSSFTQVESFLTSVTNSYTPGNVMALAEGVANETCTTNTNHLLGTQSAASMTVGNGNTPSPLILRYPQSMFQQTGDIAPAFASGLGGPGWIFQGAGISGYSTTFGVGSDSLHRLVTADVGTTCIQNKSSPTCDLSASSTGSYIAPVGDTGYVGVAGKEITDIVAYGRYRNNSNNGIVYYLPGTQIHNQPPELRMLLDSLLATPLGTVAQIPPVTTEATRSSPIVSSVLNNQALLQGTYEITTPAPVLTTVTSPSDITAFEFPYQKGHFRAVNDASVSTAGTSFSAGTVLFDSAKSLTMPSVTLSGCSSGADGSCRYIFTTTTTTFRPTIVPIDETHVASLASPLGITGGTWSTATQQQFIDKILAGHLSGATYVPALGGVDRSTAAVIGPSPVVSGTRPTVAYFGGTDGMLHAVCASVTGNCTTLGRELWAYVPRVNLAKLRLNTARVDGSPRVVDALVDVTSGTGGGTKAWRTLLLFQTGTGDAATVDQTPAMYALDISDPFNPVVLWEYTTPSVRGLYALGQGLTVAANQVTVSGNNKWMAYAQTNNGGTGGSADVVTPIDIQTGTNTLGWTFSYAYPSAVPATGIPGGAVGVFTTGSTNGIITDLVFDDLQGSVWRIDPATGTSRYQNGSGTQIPLFQFSTDYHAIGAKPAIYSDGTNQWAYFVSGGYADQADSVWGTGVQQYLIGVSLTSYPTSSTTSLNEGSPATFVKKVALGSTNEKGYAQAVVVGNEVFVTTDSSDVNSSTYGTTGGTGHYYKYSIGTASTTTAVLATGGASSVANDGTTVYAGSNTEQQNIGTATSTTGNSVDSLTAPKVARSLWLRTE
jgi:hypothetical protein